MTVNSRDIEQAFKQGDRTAFALLLQRYQGPMFAFLGRMGFPYAHAQDLAQDAFLKAWKQRAQFDATRAAWSTWVFAIARNLALDAIASQAHRHLPWSDEMDDQLVCNSPSPSEQMESRQLRERVHRGMRALSMDDRSALALAYIEELSLVDVARIEGCSTGAMKVRIHRARQRLRDWLEKNP
jgi:RNA polymerase sigma-70 factor (ECF subfamily)